MNQEQRMRDLLRTVDDGVLVPEQLATRTVTAVCATSRRRHPLRVTLQVSVVCVVAAGVVALTVNLSSGPSSAPANVPTPASTPTDHLADEVPPGGTALDCRGHDRERRACSELSRAALRSTPGRHSLTAAGVRLSYRLPSIPGWELSTSWANYGSNYVSASSVGPQSAEAVVYWTGFPDGDWADLCTPLRELPNDTSPVDLADAISTAPGIDLVSGPSSVNLGRVRATKLILTVHDDQGCDPGYFYTWRFVMGGSFWPTSQEGDTMTVLIVPVDESNHSVVIVGESMSTANPTLTRELQQIVESTRFE